MSKRKGPRPYRQPTPINSPSSIDIANVLQKAVALHQCGQLTHAEPLYRAILKQAPAHFDALHLLGVIQFQRGDHEAAVRIIGEALKIDPKSAAASSNIGNALTGLKRLEEAIASYDRALKIEPNFVEALNNRGNALRKLGRYQEALASYNRALAIEPSFTDALNNRGNILCDLERYEQALHSFDQALSIRPNSAETLYDRGNALLSLNRHADALASYDRALAIRPASAESLNNRGNALQGLERYDAALASFDTALAINPGHVQTHYNRGNVLRVLQRHEEALASYDRALTINPGYAEAHNNRGNALGDLDRHEEAIASYDRALAIKPDYAEALNNRGNALRELKRNEDAADTFERLLSVRPDYDYGRGNMLFARLNSCDWKDYNGNVELTVQGVIEGKRAASPFVFLALSDSPGAQLRCAKTYNQNKYPASAQALWKGERSQHDRIRIAYLSADFQTHATAFLMAGLIEAHDKSKFETTAISFGPDSKDEWRSRLGDSFDRFVDVRGKSDRDAAMLLRSLEIDIAVDLKGYTQDARAGILAFRPAPIQVNFLGYPGTLGADYVDYIIADRLIIPEDQRLFYAETVAYLPDSYQPNDAKRRIGVTISTRSDAGLPRAGFVFCCFNNHYKITPPIFDIWMRLLREVEGSVLWLLGDNAAAIRNLRREAEQRGVAPDRLVFAPRMNPADHLARHRLAGLFLDTLPVNAHTTASDALWAGLPLVTCLGRSFAGRVAGSLLNAVGLPELITNSLDDYEALALDLARNEDRLAAIKATLARNRDTYPLFDTDRFCRHIETAYETMWERHRRGEPPAGFAVPPRRS